MLGTYSISIFWLIIVNYVCEFDYIIESEIEIDFHTA